MRPDETQLMRAAERALELCGLAVRVEARFVEDAPDVSDIWFEGDDDDWPEVLISYVRGAEDVRIIMGDFIFESVPYDAVPPFIQKIFLGDYDFTASKILFGRRRSMTVEVAGQKYATSAGSRRNETLDSWENAALRRTFDARGRLD
jgi:hypothetical protein